MLFCLSLCFSLSCSENEKDIFQGYVDADYVFIASPFGGTLERLAVKRGDSLKSGSLLFELDTEYQMASQSEAGRELDRAKATLEDLKKGLRPSELAALEARLAKQGAEAQQAEKELERLSALASKNFASANDIDRAKTSLEAANRARDDLKAQLETGHIGSRSDQVLAAEANVMAAEASLRKARWATEQQIKTAPIDALVFDTFYRPGEYVNAGHPVLSLLSPEYLKIRFFIPEMQRSLLKAGTELSVKADGNATFFKASVSYISPEAEYTPPVIYSQQQREKLVFLIEARFESGSGIALSPGQPVDVWISG